MKYATSNIGLQRKNSTFLKKITFNIIEFLFSITKSFLFCLVAQLNKGKFGARSSHRCGVPEKSQTTLDLLYVVLP